MNEYRKIVANNLRKARKAKGLSQEAFALEANIDRTYVSGIERGIRNPSLDMLVELAKHLGIEPAALLTPCHPQIGQQEDAAQASEGHEIRSVSS